MDSGVEGFSGHAFISATLVRERKQSRHDQPHVPHSNGYCCVFGIYHTVHLKAQRKPTPSRRIPTQMYKSSNSPWSEKLTDVDLDFNIGRLGELDLIILSL